nr:putative transposase (putative), gypsy type [Tanacetum cinerariifolium]
MVRDNVQLETAVNTITHEYLLEFTSEYGISEALRPELPGPGDRIVDFPEGKVGVYTRFFELANFRLPLSQFLCDVLGYYQIHISQLSVIGAAKVSHFEINCRVQNIVPTLSLFRVFYVPSFNSGWMSFSKRPGKNTPQCYTKPLDSLKNWNNRFFWVDECVFPTAVEWRTNASKDGMPASGAYSVDAVRMLDTHRTPIQKQPEALLCLVAVATDSSGVPSAIDKSPLDFADEAEASGRETAAPEMPPSEEPTVRESRKRGPEGVDANAPPKLLRKDHTDRPSGSSRGGKSLAAMQLSLNSNVFISEGIPDDVSDPDPLAFAGAPSHPPVDVAQSSQGVTVAKDPGSENASSP